MAISSAGIGSGLDINGIVSQLVAAERQPVELRLARKEAGVQAEISALGQLRSVLSGIKSSLAGISDGAGFDARKATSANTDVLTVTASDSAAIGSFDIEVEALAVAQKQSSAVIADPDADVGTGTLSIDLGPDSFSINLTASAASLSEVRDAINSADDNPGVTATIINTDAGTKLRLTSDRLGSDSDIMLDASGGDAALQSFAAGFSVTQVSSDARIYIDGDLVTSSSNTISGAIDGVTFTLKEADDNNPFTVSVEQSTSAISNGLEAFVNAYNDYVDTAGRLGAYDPESGVAGPLNGDAALRGASNALRQALFEAYGSGSYETLSSLGVAIEDDGKLSFDGAALNDALADDFDAVQTILAGEDGFVAAIRGLADGYIDSDGIISSREGGLDSTLDRISDDRERLNNRVARLEDRYLAQFTALDSLLAQLQQTSSFLSQQLAGLSNLSKQGRGS